MSGNGYIELTTTKNSHEIHFNPNRLRKMIPALLTQFKKIVSEKVIIIVRFLPLHDLPQSFGRRLSLISICFCFRPRGIIKISGSRENVSVIVSLKIADLSNLVGEAIRVICRKISKQNMWNYLEGKLVGR